ncbi:MULTISPECIES: S8 family serine peptidase [Brevibacillus]|uniref:S8 family serine peptidase n=1 Tax=Brevibacillus TaxID=55080 RepID=UPI000D1015F0|nr:MULTISPECIES: S8 family serine peptidase [Brevibacillus]MED1946116.1 S8 family serine peptidase [Brevibacillus formosus]MED1998962.1 S8 family serine peptidase [Brevibacillus formosus]MED2083981.1 S8 family serine peptidase [Brevibacillus formosus]PSK18031.1 peptidase S8 [Brevibacillus sp. NRRL NRS-603]
MNSKFIRSISICNVFILLSLLFLQTIPEQARATEKTKTYLIGFKDSKRTKRSAIQGTSVQQLNSKIMVATLTESEREELSQDRNVAYIEEDSDTELAEIDLTEKQEMPWGVEHIGALQAHSKNYLGKNVKIGILDTGISRHEDLNVSGGISYVEGEADYDDAHGHGTAVAGVIAGKDNQLGIVGVAPEAEIYSIKVLDEKGHGKYSSMIQGIEWAIQNDMDIISISAGGSVDSQALHDQIKRANEHGILVIAAAGNRGLGEDTQLFPAQYPETLSVGSVDRDNQRADTSSVGTGLDLMAPGVDILSTSLHKGYEVRSGTSLAAPHVAGAAAVIWSKKGKATNGEVRDILVESATPLGEPRFYGKGLVNLGKALEIGSTESPGIQSIESSPGELALSVGQSYPLKIKAKLTDDTTKDITEEASYASNDEKIATVKPTGLVTATGIGETRLVVKFEDKTIEIPVVVSEKVPLTPRGGLDNPGNSELIVGTYELKGWYLDPAGVSQISIMIDGIKVGEATDGDPRPDIEAKYPAYQNGNAGFHFNLDTREMSVGLHTISLAIQNKNGEQTVIEGNTFYIGSKQPVEGLHADVSKLELTAENTHQLVVSTILEDKTLKDVTMLAEYTSSDEKIVTVSPAGFVKATGMGTAIVTIRYEGQTITIPVMIQEKIALIPRWEVESPADHSTMTGASLIKGWYLDPAGVSKIEVHVDGKLVGEALYGQPRPDIAQAYPAYQNATSGFQFFLDTAQITEGQHTVTVMAVNQEGKEQVLAERSVSIERAQPAKSIAANVSKVELSQGNTQQLIISAVLQNDQIRDVTREVKYNLEDSTIASISDHGIITGLRIGQTTVIVDYQGQVLTIPISVKAAAGVSQGGLDSPLDNATISGVYPVTGWFIASSGVSSIEVLVDGVVIGEATYGVPRPEIEITDSSLPGSNVGFHYGLDTGLFQKGKHTISVRGTAKDGNQTILGSRTVQVVELLPAIGLHTDIAELQLSQGKTHPLSVKAELEDQSKQDVTKLALYTVEDPSVAKVSPDGVVTALAQGNTSLTIKYGNQSIKIPVVITAAEVLKAIGEIETPANDAIINGTYTIAGWFLHSSTPSRYQVFLDGKEVGQANSGIARPDIALLHPDYKNTHAGFSYTVDLSELQSGGHHRVSVVVTDSEGNQYPLPEKSFVTGEVAPANSLKHTESGISLAKSSMQKLQITATTADQSPKDVTAQAVYTYENANVIHVSPLGIVTGLEVGMTKIVVSYGGQTLTIPVVVTEAESGPLVAKGQIDIPIDKAEIGGTTTIQGWLLDPDGVAKIEVWMDGQLQGTAVYGGPRPDIFALYPRYENANAGFQYQLDTMRFNEGEHKITVRVTNKKGVESLVFDKEVTVGPVTGITTNLSTIELEKEKTASLTVVASYRDKSTKDVTGAVTYAIQDPAIAKIDTAGVITGLAPGNTILSVTFAGIVQQMPVHVKGGALTTTGAIDAPGENEQISGSYIVTGWFITSGEVEKIEVLMDGVALGEAKYGLERPDILRMYPEAPPVKPGFSYLLEVNDLDLGQHQLTVLVTEKDGKQTSMEKAITIVKPIHDKYTYWLQFSDQQGKDNWSYQEVSGDRHADLTWNKQTEEWKGNHDTAIGNTWIRVGSSNPVIKWEAPRSGKIQVSGWISKIQVDEGDGVNVRLLKNDEQIWPSTGWQAIEFNDEIGVEIQEELEVEQGDALLFQVDQKESSIGDLLKWTPEITYMSNAVNDNASPQIYLTSPAVGAAVSTVDGKDVVAISGFAMDPNMGDQVNIWYQLDDEDPQELTRFTASEKHQPFLYNLPTNHLKPDVLYSLRVWAVDQKSGRSLSEKVDFTLDMRAQAEKEDIVVVADWKSPKDGTEILKGEKVSLTWEYVGYGGHSSKIESQELLIYISEGGHVTSTIREKLTGTARSYVFDTSVIEKNARVEARIRSIMPKTPAYVYGGTAKLNFSVLAANQAPVVSSTEFVTLDRGLTGIIKYTLNENDVTDKIVATKLRVGFTPGGNELVEKEELIPEASQNRQVVSRYSFPLTKEMVHQTIYWTVQAQDNRGAWTPAVNNSVRLEEALPKIVIYTPVAKRVMDLDDTFTLDGTYTKLTSGEMIEAQVSSSHSAKKFTTTGTSGQWELNWTGREIGSGTYENIKVTEPTVVYYYGSLTVEDKPDAPSIVNAEAETNSLKIYWSPSVGAIDYGIQVDGGGIKKVGDVTNYTITGLQPARVYTIRLWAYTSAGISSYSSSITVETKPAEGNFNGMVENSPVRMYFPANEAKYMKIVAGRNGTYSFTLNNDSGSPANATLSIYKAASLQAHEEIAAGANGRVNPVFVAGKTYYVKIVAKDSIYATLLAKPGGEAFTFNQPKEITLQPGQTVEMIMNTTIPGKYRMVTQLKNQTNKYPVVTVLSNGNAVTPKETPTPSEINYELGMGSYTIKLTNTESYPVSVSFTVFAPLPGGTLYEYVYDQNNRIKAIKENGVESVTFIHDENGNILKSVKHEVTLPPKGTVLHVDPEKVEVRAGSTRPIKVTATLEDGSTLDVTTQGLYSVVDSRVGFIVKGVVHGMNPGTTEARVSYGGQFKTITITVVP